MNGADNLRGYAVLGVLIALGMIIGGWALGTQIKATRLSDRYVTVKGLVEKQVKSDLAIWPIRFKAAGNELAALHAKADADRQVVLDFLKQQGMQDPEIELGVLRVVDTQAREYGSDRSPYRYIVEQRVTVRTSRVDQAAAAAQKTALLLQKGIVLEGGPGEGVTYKFTGLNSIKPDMITEATRNARAAADRFAADSGSQVGSIRQANQGVFSIVDADSGGQPDDGAYGYSGGDSSIMKTVRVVTTVQYYLER
jgi:uncharacterized protein